MREFSRTTEDVKISRAMEAMLRADESGDAMEAMTAAAPFLLDELREDGPFWPAKKAAEVAFRSGDWARSLEHYTACEAQLQASPIQMQRPDDGGAAQKALGGELAKLNANISMLHLKLDHADLAVAAAAAAISNCASWPKAHARHAEALSASGQHLAAAQAFNMAAFRAEQQGASSSAESWSARAEVEVQRAEAASAVVHEREMQAAAAEFDDFFARALQLSALTEADLDALTDDIARGAASEAGLVVKWKPMVRVKEAQRNAGLFQVLDGNVTEEVLALLRAGELARMEQTCRYFSGMLDRAAQERLRRTTRCKALRALCNKPSAPESLRAILPHVAQYCVEQLDSADDAVQRLVAACAPALLDSCAQSRHRAFSGALFAVAYGMPLVRKEVFMRAFLSARAAWLATQSSQERSRLHQDYALSGDGDEIWAALRLAREERGVLSTGALLTLLHTLCERASFTDADELESEEETSTDAWVSAYNSLRELAGADIEVLLTLRQHKTDRQWYAPSDPELADSCCNIIQNVFRSTRRTLGMSPLREPMGRHLMEFLGIFNTGPNRFPARDVDVRVAMRNAPLLTAAWQSMLTSPRANAWLRRSESWGFALHLRAHQLLHDMFEDEGVDVDYWSFQALLVTQTLMRGSHSMVRQFETVEGLSTFIEDLFAMVSAYQVAVPATDQWYQRIMAQHRRMMSPRQQFGHEIWNNTMELPGPGSGFLD